MNEITSEQKYSIEYFDKISMYDLAKYIQNKWDKFDKGRGVKNMDTSELQNLSIALESYKNRGGEVSYFRSINTLNNVSVIRIKYKHSCILL